MRAKLLLLIFLMIFILGKSQVITQGYGFHEEPYHLGINIPHASITDNSGNTYVTGVSSDENSPQGNMFTVKLNAEGGIVWEIREQTIDFVMEAGYAIALDENDNPVVSGMHWNGSDMDIKTVKYNAENGSEIWSSIFDSHHGLDYPKTIKVDANGNVVVAGYSYYDENSVGYSIVKYNPQGNQQWFEIVENETEGTTSKPSALDVDQNGNIVVTGTDISPDNYQRYNTVMYTSAGELLWKQTHLHTVNGNSTHSEAKAIAFDSDGNVYVSGTFAVGDFENNKIGTIKYDANGMKLWEKTYYEINHTLVGQQLVNVNDKIYVSGIYYDLNIFTEGSILLSYNIDGEQQWHQKTSDMYVQTVTLGIDSQARPVLVTLGATTDFANLKVLISTYNPEGDLLDEKNHIRLNDGTEPVWALISLGSDINDNLFVTMSSQHAGKGYTYEVLKYTESGALPEWISLYENHGAGSTVLDSGRADSLGNTIVIGRNVEYYDDYSNSFNYFIMKQDSDSNIAWKNEVLSTVNPSLVHFKINSFDEIIVVSCELMQSSFTITKFSPSGEMLWQKEKELKWSEMHQLTIDEDDNIYLSGTSYHEDIQAIQQFSIVKFSNEGQEIWSKNLHTDNEEQNTYTLVSSKIDPNGNLVSIGTVGTFVTNNSIVFSVNPNGELNWMTPILEENTNSTGIDLDFDTQNNTFVLNKIRQSNESKAQTTKLSASGVVLFSQIIGDVGHDITPYKIYMLSENQFAIVFSDFNPQSGNKVVIHKYNMEGNEIYHSESEFNNFYRDAYVDELGNLYLLLQIQDLTAMPYRDTFIGEYIYASILKLDNENHMQELAFQSQEKAMYYPALLIPHSNGKLEIGGNLNCELGSFAGMYFFETTHQTMSSEENPEKNEMEIFLGQNYPNPASTQTVIPFEIIDGRNISLDLYDISGKFIKNYFRGDLLQGSHRFTVDISDLPKGIYFYHLTSGNFKTAKKMIVN